MGLRNKILTGLAALVVMGSSVKAEEYVYTDNFDNINNILKDSYWHSPVFTVFPEFGTVPFLIYNRCSLEFFSGYSVYGDASVCYRFPLIGAVDGITSGNLELDVVWDYMSNQGLGHVRISSSENGEDWVKIYEQNDMDVFTPTEIKLKLSSSELRNQYILIQGMNVIADNLLVRLNTNHIVPNDKLSWGQVKDLYK